MFESETTRKSFESFEVDGVTFSGTRVKDTEPFCGRYSLKNPGKIFGITEDQAGILLSQYKEVWQYCFPFYEETHVILSLIQVCLQRCICLVIRLSLV